MIDTSGTYVALGSSFAAGPGITPVVHRGALRSGRNYAHQVAATLSMELVDVTSSGATTAHVLRDPLPVRGGPLPPQIEAVTLATTLVTVTIGGNDVSYIGDLTRAALLHALVRRLPGFLADRVPRPEIGGTRQQFAEVATALAEVVRQGRRRAPRARVVLVDYLTVAGPGLPVTPAQAQQAHDTAAALADAFAQASLLSGADLVSASEASAEHGVGSAEPWVTGLRFGNPRRGGPIPFHPNLAGMTAVADLILADLR